MSVRKGHIYGLLGPSGCGKTTLLRCVLGRTELDAGEIHLATRDVKKIGYMPQDISLTDDVSVSETFNFFGRLFGMDMETVKKRREEFISLLELPPAHRLINSLSGGQQRRVSLAIAVLHNPDILILDEPTVGVDPLISQRIWDYLETITSQGKTVIITTHYIEEARRSNVIGLMREGVLLSQECPNDLMEQHNSNSLEECFMKLCLTQMENSGCNYYPDKKIPQEKHLDSGQLWNTQRFLAQLIKYMMWNKRNIPIIIYLLMVPMIQAVLANVVLGSKLLGYHVGVVNFEASLADCRRHPPSSSCYNLTRPLSCEYIEIIDHNFLVLNGYPDLMSAKEGVKNGKIWGVMVFPSNYTRAVLERIDSGQRAEDNILDMSTISVNMDMSGAWVGTIVSKHLIEKMITFYENTMEICGSYRKAGRPPIDFKGYINGKEPSMVHQSIPGLILGFCFYMTLMFTAAAFMMEKNSGLLERNLVTGMTLVEVVAAHLVIQFLLAFAQTVVIFAICYGYYENPLGGNVHFIICLVLLTEAMGTAYGFVLALIFDSERLAQYAGIGTMITLFLLMGVAWPFEGAHSFITFFMPVFPVVPAVKAYKMLAIGRSAWNLTVIWGFIESTTWIVILSLIAFLIIKIKKIGV